MPKKIISALLYYNLSVLLFAVMFAIGKILGSHMNSYEIMFFRCVIALTMIYIIIYQKDMGRFRQRMIPKRPALLLLRCFFGSMAMILTFYAYILLPMATASTIIFTGTLWVIPLSILFLRQKISTPRIIATVIGFIGVFMMLTPQNGMFYGYLIAVLCAFFQGVVTILLHKLGKTDHPILIVFYFMLVGTIISFIGVSVTSGFTASFQDIPLLIAIGLLGVVGQYALSSAYRDAEPTFLSPFQYTSLLWSSLIGYVIWKDVLGIEGWIGAITIIISAIYVTFSERRQIKLAQMKEKVFT
jgi:drug/metabolite transporter (DMT)-like permease